MKILRIATSLIILTIAFPVFAILPPNYLNIYQWRSCVSSYDNQGASFVCLPDRKPLDCPQKSWRQLINHTNLKFCPPVDQGESSHSSSQPTIEPSTSTPSIGAVRQ